MSYSITPYKRIAHFMQHPDLLRQMFKKAPPELPTHLSS